MRSLLFSTVLLAACGSPPSSTVPLALQQNDALAELRGRAVLPAETFAAGPPAGSRIAAANGVTVPFPSQPVQGFSGLLADGSDTFLAMTDNGFGSLENSADFHLRVYRIRPHFTDGGGIDVLGFFELRDPQRNIPFAIVNHFSDERILTGADFDVESFQRAPDGTFWFGDEFGPFLVHTSSDGVVLEAPVPLPDLDRPGFDVRSPQNPFSEHASAVRVMNAVRAHAQAHGNLRRPVFSPWHSLLADGETADDVPGRSAPPGGSGLTAASSDLFDVTSLKAAGYPVVVWTVNSTARMERLIDLGVDGIISDRPDLLLEVARGRGLLDADGLIDATRLDAQAHRGGRDLRPENTLPALEAGLDHLATTLELDLGITGDGVAILDHDPHVQAQKCRRSDGKDYTLADEVLLKDLTLAALQSGFICDKIFRGPSQLNDPALSPVARAFGRLPHLYAIPSLSEVFDFVEAYARYYRDGDGASHPQARQRALNAARVRFNLETKVNPRALFADRTVDFRVFARTISDEIRARGLEARADIQSFDFRTLLWVQEHAPAIRTVYLFGDFPLYDDPGVAGSDDGTNLQPENGNTPWLAGLYWPYRDTWLTHPARAQRSGGFEGMALSVDGTRLHPMLEKPLVGAPERTLYVHEFDLATRRYTSVRHSYVLSALGEAIGDFQLFSDRGGVVIERSEKQGAAADWKVVYEVALDGPTMPKHLVADLLAIADPRHFTRPIDGDHGLGDPFMMPFQTIESIVVRNSVTLVVGNDNNFPFSVGRHVSPARPDDSELVVLRLHARLGNL